MDDDRRKQFLAKADRKNGVWRYGNAHNRRSIAKLFHELNIAWLDIGEHSPRIKESMLRSVAVAETHAELVRLHHPKWPFKKITYEAGKRHGIESRARVYEALNAIKKTWRWAYIASGTPDFYNTKEAIEGRAALRERLAQAEARAGPRTPAN